MVVEHFQEKILLKLIEVEHRALVQISYSIGLPDPLSIFVNSYGTVKPPYTDKKLVQIVEKNFCLRPGIIIRDLKLKTPIYSKTACGGHFSREDQGFPWEVPKKLDLKLD